MDTGDYCRIERSARGSRWFGYLEWVYIAVCVLFN